MLPFRVIVAQDPRSFASRRLTEYLLRAKRSPLSRQTSAVRPLPVTPPPTPSPKLFISNTYALPRKCCKQKTYSIGNSFRCNTYKKHGGVFFKPNPFRRHWLGGLFLLAFHSPYVLPSSVSRKSFACHSYENCRVCTNNSHFGLPKEIHPKGSSRAIHTKGSPREIHPKGSPRAVHAKGLPKQTTRTGLKTRHYKRKFGGRGEPRPYKGKFEERSPSRGAAMIARTRSRSAGTSSFRRPVVSMVSCR